MPDSPGNKSIRCARVSEKCCSWCCLRPNLQADYREGRIARSALKTHSRPAPDENETRCSEGDAAAAAAGTGRTKVRERGAVATGVWQKYCRVTVQAWQQTALPNNERLATFATCTSVCSPSEMCLRLVFCFSVVCLSPCETIPCPAPRCSAIF
jgi:hypothetical protein